MFTYRKLTSMFLSLIVIFSLTLSVFQPVSAQSNDSLRRRANQQSGGNETAWTSARPEAIQQNQDVTPTATAIPTEPPVSTETPLPTETPVATVTETLIPTEASLPTEPPALLLEALSSESDVDALAVTLYVKASGGSDSNTCLTIALACATINGAIGKAAVSGDTIRVATGTYTGTGTEVVLINKSINLSGGWNTTFTTQSGQSTINGQGARRGITVSGVVTVLIERFIVQNGFTDYGGGIANDGDLTLTDSVISNNTANNVGGGISTGNGILNLNQTTVSNNINGGIYIGGDNNSGGTVTLNNSSVNTNTGYGISNYGSLILNSSTVSGNADVGVYNHWHDLTINNSTISNNLGSQDGGGLYNHIGNVVINNTTISGNSAIYRGGGISVNSGTVSINNSTLSRNTTSSTIYGGGGIYNSGAIVTLRNTLLGNNEASSDVGPDCLGTIVSSGYNLIGNNFGCTFSATTGDLVGTNANPINPHLTALQDHGGTTLTHALITGSAAINAGSPASPGSDGNACLATDQRGIPRPVSTACDIGAFEGEVPGVQIAGNAGVAGATLSYTDGIHQTVTANGSGFYIILVPLGWSGTVTPSKPGYTFVPVNRTYNNVVVNQTAQSYSIGIQDPSFEAFTPNPYWLEFSTNFGTPLCTYFSCGDGGGTAGPRTGSVWNWFGGIPANEIASVSQNVTLPAGGCTTLQFYFWIGSAEPGSDANDYFAAKIAGNTIFSANATQIGSYPTYTLVSVNVGPYADGTPKLIEFYSNTSGQSVTFNLDDVSIVSGNCTISGNAGAAGVTLGYTDGTPKTVIADGSGNYIISVPQGWSGTVTPVTTGFPFTPVSRSYSNIQSNQTAQNYTNTWVGSVSITSNKNVVAVGRPHVGAEVASYNGFSAGALTAYIPMLFKDAFGGSYDSAFYIQNVHASNTATLSIKFYDSSGNLSCTVNDTLEAQASKGYWVPGQSCLLAGWVGGVVVTSNQPIVAIGRPHVGAEVLTYDGFSAGSTTSYIPMLFKDAFGGSYDSAFYIQNVHASNTATIAIKFYDSAGVLSCTINDTVLPLASKGYWVPGQSCLPTGWTGGVVVTSNQPIVTVGRPHIAEQITTYNGFAAGVTSSYIPMLFKDAFGGSYDAAYYVQNVHASNTANLTIKYYDSAGTLTCTVNDTVLPLASKGYWVPAQSCLPTGWVGGVVITSDQPIVAVGRPHVGAQVTTYNGFTAGSTNSYLPMLFKDAFGGSYDSALYIQNTEATTAAVTTKFYDSAGVLVCTRNDNIPALSTIGIWLPSTTCNP